MLTVLSELTYVISSDFFGIQIDSNTVCISHFFFSANYTRRLHITPPPPSPLQKIKNLVAAKLVYNLQNDCFIDEDHFSKFQFVRENIFK